MALLVASMGCWLERQAEARIEYLKAENRLLRSRLERRRVLFSAAERRTLATLAKDIGTKLLRDLLFCAAFAYCGRRAYTIYTWHPFAHAML